MELSEGRREFLASYQQYKDFVASNLWADFQATLLDWISDLQGFLENETVMQEVHRFQGRIQACRQLLALPDRIVANMELANADAAEREEQPTPDQDTPNGSVDIYYLEQLQRWNKEDLQNG